MSGHVRAGYHPALNSRPKKDGEKTTQKEQGFYHSPAWRRVRLLALQRDNYLCKIGTSKKCTHIATEVHHVKPLEDHPELALDLDNLISCCWWCHEETKPRGSRPRPSGVRIISVRDGADGDESVGPPGDQPDSRYPPTLEGGGTTACNRAPSSARSDD